MSRQTTLLTCHKGIDLHAATAARVMRERLQGGDRLVALRRGEYHTFWTPGERELDAARLLAAGRYFNPNKHYYGHFVLPASGGPWYERDATCQGIQLPRGWPGEPKDGDLDRIDDTLYERLLGGAPAADCTAIDVCAFPLGEQGPLLSGVLWRLVLRADAEDAAALADGLVATTGSRHGLLVNPHMQGWLIAVRSGWPAIGSTTRAERP